MTEDFYIGQVFEDMYPSEAADWCNTNGACIDEIEPIEKDEQETYLEPVMVEQEVLVPATDDEPEHIEIHLVQEMQEKTRMVTTLHRRFQIVEIPEPTEEQIKQARIAELKAQLDSTDYKIIKCSENALAGIEPPYDIAELHAQRQAIRDEINELEK